MLKEAHCGGERRQNLLFDEPEACQTGERACQPSLQLGTALPLAPLNV
jgi:hypothetical protein